MKMIFLVLAKSFHGKDLKVNWKTRSSPSPPQRRDKLDARTSKVVAGDEPLEAAPLSWVRTESKILRIGMESGGRAATVLWLRRPFGLKKVSVQLGTSTSRRTHQILYS